MTIDATHIYFRETSIVENGLVRIAIGSPSVIEPFSSFAPDAPSLGRFLADETHVYWTEVGEITAHSRRLGRIPKATGVNEILGESPIGGVFTHAVGGGYVYWATTGGTFVVFRMPTSGGTPEEVVRMPGPRMIAFIGGALYAQTSWALYQIEAL